ncbi:MAG: nucleotide exchange factor GrpE [Lachnospiraceae bacterium]|nr:nucleotide exchange factor GrpE [Lachnospiraceae bacterium]
MSKKGHSPNQKKVNTARDGDLKRGSENFETETEKKEETSKNSVKDDEIKEDAKKESPKEEEKESEKTPEETEEKADTASEEEKTNEKPSPEQKKIEDLEDRVKRQMAEFENFRKRTEKEKADSFDRGSREVFQKILPVIDNFERGLSQAQEGDAFADGMKMIYKQLTKILSDMGLEVIETDGKEFDPNLHNAVMHVEDEELGENIIVEELQKGYQYHGIVVRPSMVKVAN